jgi:acyl-ACP thioesterase
MENEYKRKFFIGYSNCDRKVNLSVLNSLFLIQDMMTEYFGFLKSDNIILKSENNAIWVLAKTKVHFNKYPKWRDLIEGTVFTTGIKPIRVETEAQFKDKDNNVLFYANQETCVIDLTDRKIRKINTVNYPTGVQIKEGINKEKYLRLNTEFTEADKVYEQKIHSTDIDFSYHTNNVSYVKYILNSLNSDFIDSHKITDFEVHYINESKEGQKLSIYKKIKDNEIEFLIKEENREIARANLKYIKE